MGWRQRLTTPPWPQAGPARSAGSCSEIPVNRLGLTLSQGSAAGEAGMSRASVGSETGGWLLAYLTLPGQAWGPSPGNRELTTGLYTLQVAC